MDANDKNTQEDDVVCFKIYIHGLNSLLYIFVCQKAIKVLHLENQSQI